MGSPVSQSVCQSVSPVLVIATSLRPHTTEFGDNNDLPCRCEWQQELMIKYYFQNLSSLNLNSLKLNIGLQQLISATTPLKPHYRIAYNCVFNQDIIYVDVQYKYLQETCINGLLTAAITIV